jgi:hypothetical protein
MPYLDHSAQVTAVVVPFALLFTAAIVIAVLWMPFKARLTAIEVLKTYAEKGEEPPASVLEAVERMNAPIAPPRPTRGEHLSHVAGSVVLASGAAGLAWWRELEHGGPDLVVIAAAIVAIFFAGAAAARLVAALTTRNGR